jgi:hypothetical protein
VHPLLARTVRRRDDDTARQEDLRRVLLHSLTASTTPPAATPLGRGAASYEPGVSTGLRRGPGPLERTAAFDLQIELVTRVGVQPLPPDAGSLREALTSLHTLFATARNALHQTAAEDSTPVGLPRIASSLVNEHLRPFLTAWHTALQQHETSSPSGMSSFQHEQLWEKAPQMRAELAALRAPLVAAAHDLGQLCGIDLLGDPPAQDASHDEHLTR